MGDQVALSTGFFQVFAEQSYDHTTQPYLQIIEMRKILGRGAQNGFSIRARMSDGAFSFSYCVGADEIADRFEQDGLLTAPNAIIHVTEFTRTNHGQKLVFCVVNYNLVTLSSPVIGNPQQHSGRPDEYRGFENYPLALSVKEENPVPEPSPARKRVAPLSINRSDGCTSNKRPANRPDGGVFGQRIFEIKDITPYVSKFLLCGIASGKEEPRQIQTKKGPSKVFSFILTDENGDAVKITSFGEQCDKYSDVIKNSCPFYVSCSGSGVVRESNKRFNSTGHTYEVSLNGQCEVEPCLDRDLKAGTMKLNIVPLSEVKNHANECVDVFAVIDKVEDLSQVVARATQKTLTKRNVTLVDDSACSVQMTLWEDLAVEFDPNCVGQVLGVKGASVREFNGGFSLSVGNVSQLFHDLDHPKRRQLYDWYSQNRDTVAINPISSSTEGGSLERDLRMIGVVIGSSMVDCNDDRGIYINVKAMINAIKIESAFYQACTKENCKKKVAPENNQYNCSRCGLQDNYRYLYMLSLEIADITGTTWVTLFNDSATGLLGKRADELASLQEADREQYEQVFDSIRFQEYIFRCRVKMETFNDRQNLRWNVDSVTPVPYDRFNKILQNSLDKFPLSH